ncbi:LysR family transcriptional regulator [Actinocorallia herbida]|uniref:LysR family transcriptional regulator n=1 Tax=Actinocorallia herbida TaxID=58109 RepID=A0A3N1CWK0_9ACTN|nr:LysR family transcriptional regulator [Actinocorallia herbida]ROO85679.1 LysR family transcriptional regulator [Actinocorallia herbida]
MQLESLDLNLLMALHALLEERNVTRAGRRLGLSQPAMSANLARLRRHFGDELLIRVGNVYELTPLAAALIDSTMHAVNVVERVFSARPSFDPATSDREFTIVTSDYAVSVMGEELMRILGERAPHVRMRFLQINVPRIDDVDTTLRSTDGVVMPHGFISGYPSVDVYADRWVVLADPHNPALADGLTMDHLGTLPWVATFRGPTASASAARQLNLLGVKPRVEMVVENFQSLPFLVAGTGRIALIQERLASKLAAFTVCAVHPCPYEAVPVLEALWFHPVHHSDPAHRWLRDTLIEVGRHIN